MALLKAAYDMGINTWDTANMYSNGASEEIVGKALKKYDIPRHKVVILTKCFWATSEDMGVSPFAPFPSSLSPLSITVPVFSPSLLPVNTTNTDTRARPVEAQRLLRPLKRLPEPIRPLPRRNLQPSRRLPRPPWNPLH